MKKLLSILLAISIVFSACNNDKKVPVFSDISAEVEEIDNPLDNVAGEEVVVPFREENGVKYVEVKVNGVGLEMIFDTGCSITLISVAEANYLYQKGKLTDEDILGLTQAQIADGSIIENMIVNLKDVTIGDKIQCPDVTATVSANINAPLLLGNEVLDRLATIVIDNENKTLIFKLK